MRCGEKPGGGARASRPTEGKGQYSIVFETFPKLQKLKYRIEKNFPHAEKPPPKRGLLCFRGRFFLSRERSILGMGSGHGVGDDLHLVLRLLLLGNQLLGKTAVGIEAGAGGDQLADDDILL